jgi:hypothetical protein
LFWRFHFTVVVDEVTVERAVFALHLVAGLIVPALADALLLRLHHAEAHDAIS